jgi:hypothetical protein
VVAVVDLRCGDCRRGGEIAREGAVGLGGIV